MKPELRTVSPDDPKLRTAYIFYKFVGVTLLLLWFGAIATVIMYGALPNFAKIFLWVIIWIIMPDIKSVKLLFSNFESYRHHKINESTSQSLHTAFQFGLYHATMFIKSKLSAVSQNDQRLRTEFIFLKFAGGTILSLWLGAVVALIMYGFLPNFTKLLLVGVILIIYPDIKGIKLLFSNFESYRRQIDGVRSMGSD